MVLPNQRWIRWCCLPFRAGNVIDADELQSHANVYIVRELLRKWPAFRPERGIRTWTRQACIKRLVKEFGYLGDRPQWTLIDEVMPLVQHPVYEPEAPPPSDRLVSVFDCFEALQEGYRDVLTRAYVDGQGDRLIGEETGRTLEQARHYRWHAVRRLKKALQVHPEVA